MFAYVQDAACAKAIGNVCQSTERKVSSQLGTMLFHILLPHVSARGVVWKWEVDLAGEELLKLYFGTLFGLAAAANDGDASFFVNELLLPL